LVKDEAHIAYHSFPLNIQGKEMIELDLSQIHFRTCQILIKKNNLVSAFISEEPAKLYSLKNLQSYIPKPGIKKQSADLKK